jgi:uncharacterized membrane protein
MVSRLGAGLLVLAVCAGACGGGSTAPTVAAQTCEDPDASKAVCAADAGPTYNRVRSIINSACVPCHDGSDPDGSWPLTDYDDIAAWASTIKDDMLNCSMPPADGGVPITRHDRDLLVQWLLCDTPR